MRALYLKIFSIFKNERRHVLILLPFCFVMFLTLTIPSPAHALLGPIDDWVGSAVGWGVDHVFKWVIEAAATAIFGFTLALFQTGVYLCQKMAEATSTFAASAAVADGWAGVRTIALSLIGLAIIAIAFMNVMRINIESWGVSKLIPRLLFATALVIFSKFMCVSVINFSNALANTILDVFRIGGVSEMFADLDSMSQNLASSTETMAIQLVFGIFIIAAVVFLSLMVLLVALLIRMFLIAFLITLSPLAFVLFALPITEKYFKEWWKTFIKWVFFWPIAIMILAVGNNFNRAATGAYIHLNDLWQEDTGAIHDFFVTFGSELMFIVAVPLAVYLPLKLLGSAGQMLQGVMSGKTGVPGAPIDPKAIRDAGKARSKMIGERKAARVGALMRRPFGEGTRARRLLTGVDDIAQKGLTADHMKLINAAGYDKYQMRAIANGATPESLKGTGQQFSSAQERMWKELKYRGVNPQEAATLSLADSGGFNSAALVNKDGTFTQAYKTLEKHSSVNKAAGGSKIYPLLKGASGGPVPFEALGAGDYGSIDPGDHALWQGQQLKNVTPTGLKSVLDQKNFKPEAVKVLRTTIVREKADIPHHADLLDVIDKHEKGKII